MFPLVSEYRTLIGYRRSIRWHRTHGFAIRILPPDTLMTRIVILSYLTKAFSLISFLTTPSSACSLNRRQPSILLFAAWVIISPDLVNAIAATFAFFTVPALAVLIAAASCLLLAVILIELTQPFVFPLGCFKIEHQILYHHPEGIDL